MCVLATTIRFLIPGSSLFGRHASSYYSANILLPNFFMSLLAVPGTRRLFLHSHVRVSLDSQPPLNRKRLQIWLLLAFTCNPIVASLKTTFCKSIREVFLDYTFFLNRFSQLRDCYFTNFILTNSWLL